MELKTLKFTNSDARPKVVEIRCDAASVPDIMAWYGAYFAGDRYSVTFDGQKLKKDQNGEVLQFEIPHADGTATLEGVRFGCHADTANSREIDGCVIDQGCPQDCMYAERVGDKWSCPEWKELPAEELMWRKHNV